MRVIAKANDVVLAILKNLTTKSSSNRFSCYCISTEAEEGVLLFHTLTKEMLLLSPEEYAEPYQLDYLKEHWFVVPEDTKEKEHTDLVRWIMGNQQGKTGEITSYTIFTTTDCNARCFYCFELGRSRIPMSPETAVKVVAFIKKHCGGKPVTITWFGGEPLMNTSVIDVICDGLRCENIEFESRATTNGYLFDEEMVRKAVTQWKLKRIQLTLDGTETVYNKIKAYIHKGENAYQRVLNNIGLLLDASVAIEVRLNVDLYNAEDLLHLVDELSLRFGSRKGLSIYAQHLFKSGVSMAELHTDEEWGKRDAAMCRLEDRIQEKGFFKVGLSKKPAINKCMVDGGKAITILPDGNIGLCGTCTETEFIGTLDSEGFDSAVVASWKEQIPVEPECEKCFFYPDCIRLKKCTSDGACYRHYRQDRLRRIRRLMMNRYNKWKIEQA